MLNREKLIEAVYHLFDDPSHKDDLILELFQYQITNNSLFRRYVETINGNIAPTRLNELTYLPISFFKTQSIKTGNWKPNLSFSSSGTTDSQTSKHYIREITMYEKVSKLIFESHFGSLKDKVILALLPSYLERTDSSLVYMVNYFMEQSLESNNFFLYDHDELHDKLISFKDSEKEIFLFGVSYALLDFAARFKIEMPNLIVVETGGMKGRRKEMVRQELHASIKYGFPNSIIQSEYGMTELLSQSYLKDNNFKAGLTKHITIREISDPFTEVKIGKTGIVNIVDLANIDSLAFIETQDLGRLHKKDQFEILGRVDNSMARGCNLMYA